MANYGEPVFSSQRNRKNFRQSALECDSHWGEMKLNEKHLILREIIEKSERKNFFLDLDIEVSFKDKIFQLLNFMKFFLL